MNYCYTTSLLAAMLVAALSRAQMPAPQQTAIVLKRTIEQQHVAPRPVNDAFSNDFYKEYFNAVDGEYMLLTAPQYQYLEANRSLIDNELTGGKWNLVSSLLPLLEHQLLSLDSLLQKWSSQPPAYTVGMKVIPEDYVNPAASRSQWIQRWQQTLTAEVADRINSMAMRQLAANGAINRKALQAKVPELFTKVIARHRQYIVNMWLPRKRLQERLEEMYLQTLASCFDPHTNFFSSKDRQSFQQSLDTEGYYYGFSLSDNKNHEVVIEELMPGGPAWKSGQINKGDVVVQLKGAQAEPIDLELANAAEVNGLIDEADNSEGIVLTVRKANGSQVAVPLKKEKLDNDAQVVRSFVLNGPQKIGYLYLPSFYTKWEDGTGTSCAADVAREVVQLKKEGIQGLILDVRFNGGGSTEEALELTGIFVNEGPLCLVRDREGKTITAKDAYRGTVWDGPLLLMVNGASASASELLAAALQDYNRAIIAGSATHGKATGQSIEAVDTVSQNIVQYQQTPNGNFVKITKGRLYRLTGRSVQASGVQPHIALPDAYADRYTREKDLPNALQPDSVAANKYYQPLPPLPVAALAQQSAARTAANTKFAAMQQMVKAKNDVGFKSAATPDGWEAAMKNAHLLGKQLQQTLDQNTTIYKAGMHTADRASGSTTTTDAFLEMLSRDPFVEECYQVLNDLIQLNRKPK